MTGKLNGHELPSVRAHIHFLLLKTMLLVGEKSFLKLSEEIHQMWSQLEYIYSIMEMSFSGTNFMWLFLETALLLQKAPLNREYAVRGNFLKNRMLSRVIFASPGPKGPSPCPLQAQLFQSSALRFQNSDLDRWGSHYYAPFQRRTLKFYKERDFPWVPCPVSVAELGPKPGLLPLWSGVSPIGPQGPHGPI